MGGNPHAPPLHSFSSTKYILYEPPKSCTVRAFLGITLVFFVYLVGPLCFFLRKQKETLKIIWKPKKTFVYLGKLKTQAYVLVPIRGSTFDRMCTGLDSRHIRTNEKFRIRNRTSNLLVFGDRVLDHHTSLDLEPLKTVVGAVAPVLFWIVCLHRLTWCSGPILCQWMGWSSD